MLIPKILLDKLVQVVSEQKGSPVLVGRIRALGGGSINEACLVEMGGKPYFVKWNNSRKYPGMFEAEAEGLGLLASAKAFRIPAVFAVGQAGDLSYLMLEYIERGAPKTESWEAFGHALAALHKHTSNAFGLGRDNYIGSLPQTNGGMGYTKWSVFFVECRMLPQLKMARNGGLISQPMMKQFEKLFEKMEGLFPSEPPSLLHGDLWGGNHMFDAEGRSVIFDPAVYYGHREMDLAMTQLFGGFDQKFFGAYHESYPLATGWRQRIGLCNLYPLLVHVNLFGGGYLLQVKEVLDRFV